MKARKTDTPTAQELQRLFDLPSGPSPRGELLPAPEPQTAAAPDIDDPRVPYYNRAVEGLKVLFDRADGSDRGLSRLRAVADGIESWIRISEMSKEELFEAGDQIVRNLRARR
jgi:hypothetical protein